MKIESNQPVRASAPDPLLDVSREFEAVFVNQLIGAMRNTVVKDGYVRESHAEKVYQALLDREYAVHVARADQIGLARVIHNQLLRSRK